MGSESEEFVLEGSDESLLDFKEINDVEFDIPSVAPPSLEKVLWDMESEGSDNVSLHSFQSMTSRFRSTLSHCILQGLSTQISTAADRVNAGLPTVITNSPKYVAVGTSHGYILNFDSEQNLCWCHHDLSSADEGAVSSVAFNLESTRLLVGYERGHISMLDIRNGDILRKLPDAHAPQSAALHIKFTFLSNIALVGDSSGCVFSLVFHRRFGIRSFDSKCLFSGARGEVGTFEPLTQGHDISFLSRNIVVAMATLSKVIVISIRPRLKVHFCQPLPKIPTSLPLISWQLVSINKAFQPVLAWGRGNELHYTKLVYQGFNQIKMLPLRNVQLPYAMTALHWLGPRHLALLDTSENLRLVEVRTQRELEVLELSNAGLVYGSAHFKALAVGGGVSEAFALAGERACYNSLSSRGNQLLVLGTKAVHLVKLRSWPERISYLSDQGRWSEALNLAAEEGLNKEDFTLKLLQKYLDSLNQNRVDKDSLTAAVSCCVKLEKIEILCDDLLEAVSTDPHNLEWYFTLIIDHICNGGLKVVTPSVCQMLVNYLEKKDPHLLESVLLLVDIACLDLHQVLKICKKLKLYNAWIHITTRTLADYTGPLTEFLVELTPDNNRLGNTMLVYVSSCLAGLGYPKGNIPDTDIPRVKHDVLRCLETIHSINSKPDEGTYPYLRALLRYNIRECLNVVELAFTEVEFSGEMGQLQRQRLVNILLRVVSPPDFSDGQIKILCCFIARLVISGNLQVEESVMKTVISALTYNRDENLNYRDHSEREQTWLDLLQAHKLDHFNYEILLDMALKAKCYKVAEYLYELHKDYGFIVQCYLRDPVRKTEVFNYILNYVEIPERCVQEQLLLNFKNLVSLSSSKTAEIVVEHFPDLIEQFTAILDENSDLQYDFLGDLVTSDVKLPPQIAEKYLEQLCIRDKNGVRGFVQQCKCRTKCALNITRKYEVHSATALLLEHSGEWPEALELLINHDLIDEAVALCVRGAEHLSPEGAQQLWLILLQSKRSTKKTSLRYLLHAAAPHVPPEQLLELVSNANFGDVRELLSGMFSDYKHDIEVLKTSMRVMGNDFHHKLAKSLHTTGKPVSVSILTCRLCRKPLSYQQELNNQYLVAIRSCGHHFHTSCMETSNVGDSCPQCQMKGRQVPEVKKSNVSNHYRRKVPLRPDLEGLF